MHHLIRISLCGILLTTGATEGCRTASHRQEAMVQAIDAFYDREPSCLWMEPIELPVEVDVTDVQGRAGLDALVDQGLLARSSVAVDPGGPDGVRYELTPSGMAAWHPEPGHPGSGNVCYGLTRVAEVGSVTQRQDARLGMVYEVSYLTDLKKPPLWTMASAMKESFPRLKMELTGPMPASAALRQEGSGWKIVVSPTHSLTTTGPSGGIKP